MSISTTVLFGQPQSEIASLIIDKLSHSNATSIVTGFATPGGLDAIARPIKKRPGSVATVVVGAGTYPAFQALDDLVAAGVPVGRLYVHLGHTRRSSGKKNPFVRHHPMLHSKVYYMELPGGQACAFIGSHNITSFAMTGLNGEAAVLLEGAVSSPEFVLIRQHIETARAQATAYNPGMKEALAWWTREFLDGLKAEMRIPEDWKVGRTILILAQASKADRPAVGDDLYFEIPAGIEQIVSLKTEIHLFLFEQLPADPWTALQQIGDADARYTGVVRGAEDKRGNLEVVAQWRIDGRPRPFLRRVAGARFRPNTATGLQQVRGELEKREVEPFEYSFEHDKKEWEPQLSDDRALYPRLQMKDEKAGLAVQHESALTLWKDADGVSSNQGWSAVTGLVQRLPSGRGRDEQALALAAPESGHFILVALRKRRLKRQGNGEQE